MKKWINGVVCIVFLGFLVACGGGEEDQAEQDQAPTEEQDTVEDDAQTEEETPTADAGDAETKFKQSCAQCHGADLVSGGAPDLNVVGTKYSKDEILGIIKNGKGNMPGGILTGEDAEAVASWLAEKK